MKEQGSIRRILLTCAAAVLTMTLEPTAAQGTALAADAARTLLEGKFIAAAAPEAAESLPAENETAEQNEPGAWPALDGEGYLPEGEFVYEGAEEGLWRYASPTLKIEIRRMTQTKPVKLIWYEAEVWSREEVFHFITNEPGKHFSSAAWPPAVASKNGAVLAFNGDYASYRWNNIHYPKQRQKVGILLRDGEIKSSWTKKSGGTSFPNLDTMAIYPDGLMEVHDSQELTAEEYLAKGAVDVLSFGPWMIRDGEIRNNLKKFAHTRAPRTCLGMIEPGHYIVLMAEGRRKVSLGATLDELAELLREKGCTTAFNMDGGETACILFMGKQLCVVGGSHSNKGYARKEPEFLAIGTSALVEGYEGQP